MNGRYTETMLYFTESKARQNVNIRTVSVK